MTAALAAARQDFQDAPIDPRLAFLARASARLVLYEAGKLTLEQAVDGLPICTCAREITDGWERNYPPRKQRSSRR